MLIYLTQMCSSYRKIFAESPQPMSIPLPKQTDKLDRRSFIGGSDARTIMGADEDALLHLWREKRGEIEPEDLAGNLIVQLGIVTEPLNRHWYQQNTGQTIKDVQRKVKHPVIKVDGGDARRHSRDDRRGF